MKPNIILSKGLRLAQVKDRVSFEQVLERYGIKARGTGTQRMVLCPFHQDRNPSCSIHLERKVFWCFGCGARGTILDFVARMEHESILSAAAHIEKMCGELSNDGALSYRSPHTPPRLRTQGNGGLQALSFKLTLDPSHPYLTERGVSPDIAAEFGLGYCNRGTMKERICIPIHDEHGVLVAYAGRWAGAALPEGISKYKLPRGFEKRRVLFGLHRIAGPEHVVLVEGCWSVFRLRALGIPAVALMGRTLSPEQETLLIYAGVKRLTLLLDGDRPGREASDDLLAHLARPFVVRAIDLPDGAEPDTVSEQFLLSAFAGRR